ncbi:MAG TPA: DUF4919 domain-containing protein [Lentimicrobium sp.]|nr:DUF4919 domain-containing protein [Lentimicrobium sp.]
MKKSTFLLSLFIIPFTILAQQSGTTNAPDFKRINKALNKGTENYSNLMQRYKANDTTLTREDYHLLYYGYALQTGYDPSKDTDLRKQLADLFNDASNGNADYLGIQGISNKILDQLPFDIRTLDPAIYASEMLKDQSTAKKLEFKMGRIIETIFNSGDGRTQESPFYVISLANIPDMVRALGFEAVNIVPEQSGNLFYFRVKENDFGITAFYFKIFGR